MSHLTEQQKEALLHAEYAVRHALIELSAIDSKTIISLGEHGQTLNTEIDRAMQSLEGSSQLVISLIFDVEGK